MLANLLHSIEWRHAEKSGASEVVVLVDDSFAEALKWNLDDAHVSPNYFVLPLAVDDSAANQLGMSNASRFVVFTSKLSMSVALTIMNMLQSVDATECCILSSASPESVEFTSFSGTKANSTPTNVGYQGLQDFLLPVKTRITYFPLHTIHLLGSNPHDLSNQQVGVGVLSSHSSRIACPLTLSAAAPTSEDIQNSRNLESILEVNVADLPDGVKTELKALAHDLAGALVFDYDLDVSASIFALGKTSSILGHNILPVLEQLTEQRSASRGSEKRTQYGLALRKHLPHNTDHTGDLQPAALVLIDRTEDLLTPLSAGSGPTPLAHRIVNTLNYCQYLPKATVPPEVGENGRSGCKHSSESLQCDVSLRCPLLETVSADAAVQMLGMGATDATTTFPKDSNWNFPMSALANLPLQLTHSLLYKPASTHNVLEGILSQSEEAGRAALCNELKAHIQAESGALPPNKKRGLGAEMLAYTQALIVSPGCSKERVTSLNESSGYSAATCTRNQSLLSLSLALVEAMQRSSGKQFTSLCVWQCAYDVRSARESELDGIARKYEDFDICVAHLSTLFLPKSSLPSDGTNSGNNSAINSPPRGSAGLSRVGSAKSVVSEKEAPPTAGPVDVVHILIQLLRLVSMFRQRIDSSTGNNKIGGSLSSLTQCLCDYLLLKSPVEELQYLQGLHFLSTTTVEEILSHRLQSEQLDVLFAAQIQAAEGANTLVEDTQNQIENIELILKQIRSSVLDQITSALQTIYALQQLYNAQKSALFENSSRSSGNAASVLSRKTSTNECLDLLKAADDTESIGLVARIARAYLTQRGGNDNSSDPLVEMLEFIETPLQKMKRAGLGLLSKGLGSLGFGFGSQVASSAVTTPQPSDQPVLVLFVLGGISYKEVGQVQQLLSQYGVPKTKIIVLSTRIVNAENVLYTFFTS